MLELTEAMLQPEDQRAPGQEGRRTVVRRLRCLEGARRVMHRVEPREDYRLPADVTVAGEIATLTMPSVTLAVWSSHAMQAMSDGQAAHADVTLIAGETLWAVLDDPAHAGDWTVEHAETALAAASLWWTD